MVRSKLKDQNINLHATYNKNKRDSIMSMFTCDTASKSLEKIYYIGNFFLK